MFRRPGVNVVDAQNSEGAGSLSVTDPPAHLPYNDAKTSSMPAPPSILPETGRLQKTSLPTGLVDQITKLARPAGTLKRKKASPPPRRPSSFKMQRFESDSGSESDYDDFDDTGSFSSSSSIAGPGRRPFNMTDPFNQGNRRASSPRMNAQPYMSLAQTGHNPMGNVGERQFNNPEMERQEKEKLLVEIAMFKGEGMKPSKTCTIKTPIADIRLEVETMKRERDVKQNLALATRVIVFMATALEWSNRELFSNWLYLEGFGGHMQRDVESGSYNQVLRELSLKYATQMAVSPEIKLSFMFVSSAITFHFGGQIRETLHGYFPKTSISEVNEAQPKAPAPKPAPEPAKPTGSTIVGDILKGFSFPKPSIPTQLQSALGQANDKQPQQLPQVPLFDEKADAPVADNVYPWDDPTFLDNKVPVNGDTFSFHKSFTQEEEASRELVETARAREEEAVKNRLNDMQERQVPPPPPEPPVAKGKKTKAPPKGVKEL